MGFLFDLIYDWLIHFVPTWLAWILLAPLLALLAFFVAACFWPDLISM